MSEWISVKDETPTAYERVLVSQDSYIAIAMYAGSGWIYDDDDRLSFEVTYWLPLPKGPNE
jgi:hypothetical protein